MAHSGCLQLLLALVASLAACAGETLVGLRGATKEDLQKRAATLLPHRIQVKQLWEDPAVFLLRNVVTAEEATELTGVLRQGWSTIQESVGPNHGLVALDRDAKLNASSYNQMVNKRLAVLAGLPEENMEEGYFSVYTPGHQISHLHLDNHHALFRPARILSVVMTLTEGRTILPFMVPSNKKKISKFGPPISEEELSNWDKQLSDTEAKFKMGDRPQAWRVCPAQAGMPEVGVCETAWARAKAQCESGAGGAVELKRGDALMFSTLDNAGKHSSRVIHGGCGVPKTATDKIILSKFFRKTARPWGNQNEFTEAREAYNDQCQANADLGDEDGDYSDLEDDSEDGLFDSGVATFGDDEDIDDEGDAFLDMNVESLVDEFDVGTAEL